MSGFGWSLPEAQGGAADTERCDARVAMALKRFLRITLLFRL
ncbi:hypothetical protein OFEAOIEE_LOCUS3228 [Methylorubrum extorquens]